MKVGFASGLLTVLVLGSCLCRGVSAANRAEELFQQAVITESGERNLEAAIELYQKVLQEPGAEHLVLVKALIRMGDCLERLGKIPEAEQVYQRIIEEASTPPSEFVQEARANLRRLQAQDKSKRDAMLLADASKSRVFVHEFHETPIQLAIGPAWFVSEGHSLGSLGLAVRYRISPPSRSIPFYVEAGGVVSPGNSVLEEQTQGVDPTTTEHISLSVKYQATLTLIRELPHGLQRRVIPEVGAGMALTCAGLHDIGPATTRESKTWTLSPMITTGLHLWPDHDVSLLIRGSYTSAPFPQSFEISGPTGTQTVNFPSSMWIVATTLQIKIKWPQLISKPQS